MHLTEAQALLNNTEALEGGTLDRKNLGPCTMKFSSLYRCRLYVNKKEMSIVLGFLESGSLLEL